MIDFMDDWRSLRTAVRDGSSMLVAVAPAYDRPGYVTIGKWVAPETAENLSRQKRELFERFGGWWGRGKNCHPFNRAVLAWQPIPEFDFEAWQESQDAPQG